MEKRKHRSTKQTKKNNDHKGEATGNMEQQSTGHAERPAGGITEALRHQDEIVQEKADEKV